MNDWIWWADLSGCTQPVLAVAGRQATGLARCGMKSRRPILAGRTSRVRTTEQQSRVTADGWMGVQDGARSDRNGDLGFTRGIRCEWLRGRAIDDIGR